MTIEMYNTSNEYQGNDPETEMQKLCEKWWNILQTQGQRYLSSKFSQQQVERLIQSHTEFSGQEYLGDSWGYTNSRAKGDYGLYDRTSLDFLPRHPLARLSQGLDSVRIVQDGLNQSEGHVMFTYEDPHSVPEGELVAFSLELWQKAYDRGHLIPIAFTAHLPKDQATQFIEDISRRPALMFNLFWYRYGVIFGSGQTSELMPTKLLAVFPNADYESRSKPDKGQVKPASTQVELGKAQRNREGIQEDIRLLQNPKFLILEPFSYSDVELATDEELIEARKKIIESYMRLLDHQIQQIAQIQEILKRDRAGLFGRLRSLGKRNS